ncbi:diaminopropionate ammonia-lyase [Antarcticibacterium sp. 1MA-6-2]|uniref:diaminopropionate ammonia-lyase n=1 Tax=Antarcticibacterium sp. 1MA-6-2 TaxID=2908210 RepID=UPI001F3A4768|nr:diaminopropionate ammonia-lyase [Antarcticibacterium sp. 1MA-6-2]UJH90255.1 diaminopropionate ammonia-lyase [Antarcticibacterium sp. 1MA-6-2]
MAEINEQFHGTPFHYINNPDNRLVTNCTDSIFRASDPLSFHNSLAGYKPTPLVELKNLAKKIGVREIYIKDESYRFGLNAFKALGASYAIHKILEKNPEIETFCTATDGNHGRAVAWSARIFDKKSRIFVPSDTTTARIDAIRAEGAVVEKIIGNYEETCAFAKKRSLEYGWTLLQDTATEDYEEIPAHIMAGYFTHFKELEDGLHQLPEPNVDVVFLQSGVGSWPAAAAWYYTSRYSLKRPKLVIVEPKEAAGMLASLIKGERCSPSGSFKTMMAGLNCGIPSSTAWEILKNTIDVSIAIEDKFMEAAIRTLFSPSQDDPQVISGESGAGGFAGFLAIMNDERFAEVKEFLNINSNTRILCYSTEGATDPSNFKKIISAH